MPACMYGMCMCQKFTNITLQCYLSTALFKAIEQDSTDEVKQQLKVSGASLLNMYVRRLDVAHTKQLDLN